MRLVVRACLLAAGQKAKEQRQPVPRFAPLKAQVVVTAQAVYAQVLEAPPLFVRSVGGPEVQ